MRTIPENLFKDDTEMFEDFLSGAFLLLVAGMAFAAISQIYLIVFARRRSLAKLQAQREEDKQRLETEAELSEYEKDRYDVRIDRDFSRELSRLDARYKRAAFILTLLSAIGGILGIAVAVHSAVIGNTNWFPKFRNGTGWLIDSAYAQGAAKPELSPFIPYVAVGVLLVMGTAFFVSLGAILILKDTKENQTRIKAADNMVKMFGGFFTGLATTLLH